MRDFGGHGSLEKGEAIEILPLALSALNEYPNDVEVLHTIGHCYNVLEQDAQALEYFKRAAETPHPVTWANYASILRQAGRYEEAFPYFWNAHRAWPDDKYIGHAYAEELIRKNKWLKAWPLCSKYRFSKEGATPLGLEEWKGQDLKGKKIAVLLEGGRGDTFWLFRFIPKLVEMGANVSLLGPEDLAMFLEGHPFLGPVDLDLDRPYDYWVSIFELLQWLEVDKPYWPGVYFNAEPSIKRTLGKKKRVGLCWTCGEAIDVRKYRSLDRNQAARLVLNRNVEWVSLQKDQPLDYCFQPILNTWKDTAAVIDSLDLVIAMDTSVAHLAGAMGKPTWLLLGGYQDCKWMAGDTTGWYPSFRIFRNYWFGFDGALDKVEKELKSL